MGGFIAVYQSHATHGADCLPYIPYTHTVSHDGDVYTLRSAVWAPDVREINPSNYVMYCERHLLQLLTYTLANTSKPFHTDTAHRKGGPGNDHCIGVATASHPAGPFHPRAHPLICDPAQGGAIDPSGFQAPGGARYVLWKVDGNSAGKPTPIKIRRVGADGITLFGTPKTLITNDPIDGGLVEAPSMAYWDGCECCVWCVGT